LSAASLGVLLLLKAPPTGVAMTLRLSGGLARGTLDLRSSRSTSAHGNRRPRRTERRGEVDDARKSSRASCVSNGGTYTSTIGHPGLRGSDVRRSPNPAERRGFPQDPLRFSTLDVLDNVAFGLRARGTSRSDAAHASRKRCSTA
jgi:hypothetical protein